ncbi:alpha/beta hydrolase-fold protein [Clostridium sp. UBA4548]|uniref:alpha/beta hydrolase-fold protein n=1 Tax=Clostridium sp. UBA4548 TaxID=1946361 RepID=UPI0025B9B08B|nr:alpha/beta hydrolase-fold protein [Clostridium sp. UBA4548]
MNDVNFESEKINKLKRSILEGNEKAIDEFWKEIKENNTPIIEEIKGDTDDVLITFLYEGDKDVENVVVLDGCVGLDYEKNKMDRILDTDIWYKTFKVRNDLRFRYFLTVNDPLNEDWQKRNEECIRIDPLAKQKVLVPKDEETLDSQPWICNMVELPKAEPKVWSVKREDTPNGNLEMFRYKSKILNDEYRVWIYTPVGYSKEEEPYKMLVLSDGFEYVHGLLTPSLLDNLIYEKQIAPIVAVFIESKDNRFEMLSCNKNFTSFVAEEIVPYVRERYNVSHKPEDSIIGGLSLGGLAATYLGVMKSEVFGNVLSQSGSFWWCPGWTPENVNSKEEFQETWISNLFKEKEKLNLKFYLEVGILEGNRMIKPNVIMKDVLLSKGYQVEYSEFKGGHDYLSWGETLAKGLVYLVGNK